MNNGNNLPPTGEILEEIQDKNTLSIDDFIKQLEAKEKDLDISAEMVIEIEETDFDEIAVSSFAAAESSFGERKVVEIEVARADAASENALSTLRSEVLTLREQISKLETERVGLFEVTRRRQTDFEGYKKRVERERSETFLNQISNLVTQMLPVLDNFNRALESASHLTGDKVLDSQHFFNGIVLVNQQLNEVLSDMGVLPIVSVGETFDPNYHEAVATEETDEIPPHTITAELLRGYRIGERVIRPTMVRVSAKKVDR